MKDTDKKVQLYELIVKTHEDMATKKRIVEEAMTKNPTDMDKVVEWNIIAHTEMVLWDMVEKAGDII